MLQERATWGADTLADYRSLTSSPTKRNHCSGGVFVRYLHQPRRAVGSNYLGRLPLHLYTSLTARGLHWATSNVRSSLRGRTYKLARYGSRCAFAGVPDSPCLEMAVTVLASVRVCRLLAAIALMSPLVGADLQAQVGLSSGVTRVSLVVRAPSYATLPGVSAPREIGRRGDLREAAVRIHLLANSGYRLVARGNAGSASRVWIQVADDDYQELTPGRSVTLPGERRGSSDREVRYLTDGSTSSAELPLHFELVIDPII